MTYRKKPYFCIVTTKTNEKMFKISLPAIIQRFKLTDNELASVLFPNNRFPNQALRRVLNEGVSLSADQVSALAAYLGVPVYELYKCGGWHQIPDESAAISLRKGDLTAVLRNGGSSITIRDDKRGVEQIIALPNSLTLEELIRKLDSIRFDDDLL